jgi:hypothetical protein
MASNGLEAQAANAEVAEVRSSPTQVGRARQLPGVAEVDAIYLYLKDAKRTVADGVDGSKASRELPRRKCRSPANKPENCDGFFWAHSEECCC